MVSSTSSDSKILLTLPRIIRPWTSEEGPRTRVWDVETYENHGWMFMNQWRDGLSEVYEAVNRFES